MQVQPKTLAWVHAVAIAPWLAEVVREGEGGFTITNAHGLNSPTIRGRIRDRKSPPVTELENLLVSVSPSFPPGAFGRLETAFDRATVTVRRITDYITRTGLRGGEAHPQNFRRRQSKQEPPEPQDSGGDGS